MGPLLGMDLLYPGVLDADFFAEQGIFVVGGVKLARKPDPCQPGVSRPSSGEGQPIASQGDGMDHSSLDILRPGFGPWVSLMARPLIKGPPGVLEN